METDWKGWVCDETKISFENLPEEVAETIQFGTAWWVDHLNLYMSDQYLLSQMDFILEGNLLNAL